MNLLITAKFCQMCQKAKNDSDRSFHLSVISDHITKFTDYWEEKCYLEEITLIELDEKNLLADILEDICYNCGFKVPGVYDYIKGSYDHYKKIEEKTLRVIRNKETKNLRKKLKLTIEGNVYRSGLFKKRRSKVK